MDASQSAADLLGAVEEDKPRFVEPLPAPADPSFLTPRSDPNRRFAFACDVSARG